MNGLIIYIAEQEDYGILAVGYTADDVKFGLENIGAVSEWFETCKWPEGIYYRCRFEGENLHVVGVSGVVEISPYRVRG